MQTTISRRIQLFTSLFLMGLSGAAVSVHAQAPLKAPIIELKTKPVSITPTQFYIFRVDDERTNPQMIGKLVQVNTIRARQAEILPVQIKGGSAALTSFITGSLAVNKGLRPLVIKIKALEIDEKPVAGNRVEGRIAISLQFGLLRDGEFIKLDDYVASSTYQRKAVTAQQTEPLLGNMIGKGLLYVNNWMNNQADTNIALAKGVKINFTDHKNMVEDDTVYYDVNRPLKWVDFHGKPHNSNYAAEIFATMGYDENVKLEHGIINVTLDIKVYVPKSACWVGSGGLNNNSLAHEQLHFDIVKMVAERFKQRILSGNLNTYNYDALINMTYLDALREIYETQKQYDSETGHSLNSFQQQRWSTRVGKELQQSGVKALTAQAAELK